jgi:HK97 family phage portal protein
VKLGPFTLARAADQPVGLGLAEGREEALALDLIQKALTLQPLSPSLGGWWPWGVQEPFTGAWQRNVEIRSDTALSYYAVFACLRLISTDMGKMGLRLVEQDRQDLDVWTPTESPAFSPVLRQPNRYQTINEFIEQWTLSKLIYGNTYVLLQRDQRRVVVAMYVLDPARVTPLVTPDGAVYYELKRDDLAELAAERLIVPASEIIHDKYLAPFHPLIGISPLYAASNSVSVGLGIQTNSQKFFANGANPSGVLSAPGHIDQTTAARLKSYFETNFSGNNVGRIAVAGDGLEYKPMTMTSVNAQLVEQLHLTAEQVCSAFGVPPYLVDIGPPPPYANFEPLLLKYHSQCIQSLATNLEKSLDKGLGLVEKIEGRQLGTEFDINDLIWMDTATKTKAAGDGIRSGMSVDEVRSRYHGLPAVPGGDVVYMQEQNHSLEALAALDAAKIRAAEQPAAAVAPMPAPEPDEDDDLMEAASLGALLLKGLDLHG